MEIALKLDPDYADIRAVSRGLNQYNRNVTGRDEGWQSLALHLLDESGKPVGGLTGSTSYDWLFIELLFVPEALRGQGHGRALMAQAETFARERKQVGIWLVTFSFHARPFYEKLGFSIFGTIDDHPIGGARHFMKRHL